MRHPGRARRLVFLGLVLALLAVAVAACGMAAAAGPTASPSAAPAASASPVASAGAGAVATATPKPTPEPQPLRPAQPGADPLSLFVWLFTPIFQTLFVVLAGAYSLTGNIGIAIVILTIVIRLLTIPLFRQQIVSQRRMQMLQPELKRLGQLYKGDRQRMSQAQMELYKERGVNPAAGCLPSILQMGALFPMYYVIRDGLTSFDPRPLLHVALPVVGDLQLVPLTCRNIIAGTSELNKSISCINSNILGIDMGQPWHQLSVLGLGISLLAVASAFLQLIQSRMVMPPASPDADASTNMQRNTLLILPLMTILWGGFLPAGLYIYWIVTTIFSIIQQYLIVGWGSMFPLFGWNPAFARDHSPRFPVQMPVLEGTGKSLAATRRRPDERAASAAATVRPHAQRGRQGRRGRRR